MLSNIGWPEIFVVVVLGVIIIGPERLPGVIQDVRAAIYAARKAINNAKAELNGEFDSLGEEFAPLRDPISKAAEWGRLGPRGVLTKALFDGDDSEWDAFNPQKAASAQGESRTASPNKSTADRGANAPSTGAAATPVSQAGASTSRSFDYSQIYTARSQGTVAADTEQTRADEPSASSRPTNEEQPAGPAPKREPAGPDYAGMQPPRPGSSAARKRHDAAGRRGADYSRIGQGNPGQSASDEEGPSAGFSWADIT